MVAVVTVAAPVDGKRFEICNLTFMKNFGEINRALVAKKKIIIFVLCTLSLGSLSAQSLLTPEQLAKREKKKNLTVKEWNTDSKTKTRWLDRLKVYDSQGRCVEEIEYATYGQKWRVTSTYDDVTGKVIEEVEYNDRNRPVRIKKYEWNADGTKAKQYNYLPNGKLFSVKVFEYIFSEK
jgi:hypothetical protein